MAAEYGIYDRVLDWCSDHRQDIAKGFVLLAVVGLLAGILISALSAVSG